MHCPRKKSDKRNKICANPFDICKKDRYVGVGGKKIRTKIDNVLMRKSKKKKMFQEDKGNSQGGVYHPPELFYEIVNKCAYIKGKKRLTVLSCLFVSEYINTKIKKTSS
jgi:hypothetical protein